MKPLLALLIGSYAVAFTYPSSAQPITTVVLKIKVIKQAYGDKQLRPFAGIGIFDVLRGKSKLDGASCPDRSGPSGEISCTIPCGQHVREVMTVRVKPPSDQDSLAGWVTPAAQDVELQGCTLAPQAVTMKYDDARYALNEFLLQQQFASAPTPGAKTDPWMDIAAASSMINVKLAKGSLSIESNQSALVHAYLLAITGAKSPELQSVKLAGEEREQAMALANWQVLSKSALLGLQIHKVVPLSQRGKIQFSPTADVITYRANLLLADQLLGDISVKTAGQLRLLDDIKTLKALPATGKGADAAVGIIETWK